MNRYKKNKGEKTADAFLNNVFRNGNNRSEQKKARTLGIVIIGILTCILTVLAYLYFQKLNELEINGERTYATVIGIKRNGYRANDMDGTTVNNYLISFEFFDGEKKNIGFQSIEKKDYSDYFNNEIKVTDTIPILYSTVNPDNNRILKK